MAIFGQVLPADELMRNASLAAEQLRRLRPNRLQADDGDEGGLEGLGGSTGFPAPAFELGEGDEDLEQQRRRFMPRLAEYQQDRQAEEDERERQRRQYMPRLSEYQQDQHKPGVPAAAFGTTSNASGGGKLNFNPAGVARAAQISSQTTQDPEGLAGLGRAQSDEQADAATGAPRKGTFTQGPRYMPDIGSAMAFASWRARNPGGTFEQFAEKALPQQRAEMGRAAPAFRKYEGQLDPAYLRDEGRKGNQQALHNLWEMSGRNPEKVYEMLEDRRGGGGLAGLGQTDPETAQHVQQAMAAAEKLVSAGASPSDAQGRVLSMFNSIRRQLGKPPLTPDDVPVFEGITKEKPNTERDRSDRERFYGFVKGGMTPEQAGQLVNAERADEGLPGKDFSKFSELVQPGAGRFEEDRNKFMKLLGSYDAAEAAEIVNADRAAAGQPPMDFSSYGKPSRQQKAEATAKEEAAVKQKREQDQTAFGAAAQHYEKALANGATPAAAKAEAIKFANEWRQTQGLDPLPAERFSFAEAAGKQKGVEHRRNAIAEAKRRIAEAAAQGQDVSAEVLAEFNPTLRDIGQKPLTMAEVRPGKIRYAPTAKGRAAALAAGGLEDLGAAFRQSVENVAGQEGFNLPGWTALIPGAGLGGYVGSHLIDAYRRNQSTDDPAYLTAAASAIFEDMARRYPDVDRDALWQSIKQHINTVGGHVR